MLRECPLEIGDHRGLWLRRCRGGGGWEREGPKQFGPPVVIGRPASRSCRLRARSEASSPCRCSISSSRKRWITWPSFTTATWSSTTSARGRRRSCTRTPVRQTRRVTTGTSFCWPRWSISSWCKASGGSAWVPATSISCRSSPNGSFSCQAFFPVPVDGAE